MDLSMKKPAEALKSPEPAQTLVGRIPKTPEASDQSQKLLKLLDECLHEYLRRLPVHHIGIPNPYRLQSLAYGFKQILCIENGQSFHLWLKKFKQEYQNTYSAPDSVTGCHRVPLSLDLRAIVSYCSRPVKIRPAHKEKLDAAPPTPNREDDDDCIIIESPSEIIEISDDDDDEDNTPGTSRK